MVNRLSFAFSAQIRPHQTSAQTFRSLNLTQCLVSWRPAPGKFQWLSSSWCWDLVQVGVEVASDVCLAGFPPPPIFSTFWCNCCILFWGRKDQCQGGLFSLWQKRPDVWPWFQKKKRLRLLKPFKFSQKSLVGNARQKKDSFVSLA